VLCRVASKLIAHCTQPTTSTYPSPTFNPPPFRLVAVLDGWAYVHALQTLAQLRILETPPNPKGLAALTPCSEPCFLALPASSTSGVLRVYDLLVDGGHVVCEVMGESTTYLTLHTSYVPHTSHFQTFQVKVLSCPLIWQGPTG